MKHIIRFVGILIFFAVLFAQTVLGAEFRINSANYDISNAIVVLSAKDTSDDKIITENIDLKKLENPTRYYFDINSAVLTMPKQDWSFQSGNLDRILINQFQNNPNIVRVVIYPKTDEVISSVQFYRLKNNIIIRFNGNDIQNNYYQHIYRDEHASSSDFYENLKVVYQGVPEKQEPSVADDIQKAFNITPAPSQPKQDETEFKKFKLNTKYYLNSVNTRPNALLLNGMGEITFEKPILLQNPSRLIYDFPNALSAQNIRNQEFQINETDKIVIGQFAINKVRAVIHTEHPENYLPVVAPDNQSLLFINPKNFNFATLIQNYGKITEYLVNEKDNYTQSLTFNFDSPIVHSIERRSNALVLTIFNAVGFDKQKFNEIIAGSFFYNARVIAVPDKAGIRIYLPLRQESLVNTYMGSDGKSVKIVLKETARSKRQLFNKPVANVPCKRILIDAGHGGTDYGAIRGDINEKDIVLDVAKLVQKDLTKLGHTVIMTREDDTYVSLQDRVDISEKENADIFISIHVNSSVKPEIEGVETHYYHQESIDLAQAVHESLITNLKSFDRGLFKSKFYVINHTTMPAILCEIGFISNEDEQKLIITDKRKKQTADAIVEGVLRYFGQE